MKKYRCVAIHITENFDDNESKRDLLEHLPEKERAEYVEKLGPVPDGEHLISLVGIKYLDENGQKWMGHKVIDKPALTEEEIKAAYREVMGELDREENIFGPPSTDTKPRPPHGVFTRFFTGKRLDQLDEIAERKGISGREALSEAVKEYIERNKEK